MIIPFQGQYDRSLLFRAVGLASQPTGRRALLRWGLIILGAVIYAAYFAVMADKEGLSTLDLARLTRHLLGVPVLAFFALQPYVSAYVTASRLWQAPGMQRPVAGEISSLGISYQIGASRPDVPWNAIARKRAAEDMVVLVTAEGVISIFARRFFGRIEDWRHFRTWVDSKVMEPK